MAASMADCGMRRYFKSVQPGEPSYEDLCHAHIEALMAAAAAAEVQTGLAARVAGWRNKLAPVLEEQDARGNFDIHTYEYSPASFCLNDRRSIFNGFKEQQHLKACGSLWQVWRSHPGGHGKDEPDRSIQS